MGDTQQDPDVARLADDFVGRLRQGEMPDVDEYVARRPDLEAEIRELFPVLAVMEGLKPPVGGADLEPGPACPERIGPYRIVRELGRGGMGRVFEALATTGDRVALKIVHPHLVGRPGYLARFLREVETGTRLDHPGVVKTLDSGVAEQEGVETPYLVLEFVEGQNLRELLDEVGPLSERLCRVIGARIAEALFAVHGAGIVHRDVKPENVVICSDETVKLMDLGVALIQEETRRLSATGEFVGSLMYAAPEQVRGGNIGPEADLYALGLLLFELMTGHHVAMRDGRTRPSFADMFSAPASLRSSAPHATALMDAVVRVLLEPDPNTRPADASAVARVLREGERSRWWSERQVEVEQARPRSPVPLLFGRDAELEQLDGLLERLPLGRGGMVAVVGDPGIGKSHLVRAWMARVEERESAPRIVEVAHLAAASSHATCPLAGALVTAFGDDLEAAVHRGLPGEPAQASVVVDHLRGLEGQGPKVGVALVEAAYVTLMAELAAPNGLVMFVEDMHRATHDRRESFIRLIRATADRPIVFVASARTPLPTDIDAELRRLESSEILTLGPLDRQASTSLAQDAIGSATSSASGIRELVRRADGNPLYLVELARELARRSVSAGSEAEALKPIPESLDALIEIRLEALDPDQHDLLAAASCAGATFDPDLVAESAELPRIAGLRMLHALDREHRLLEPVGSDYRFRQRLVQEKLHDGLPPALRAAYHTALGAAIESRLSGGRPAAPYQACEISEHHLLGDDPVRALPYAKDALDYLAAQYEPRRAVQLAERVLALGDAADAAILAHAQFIHGTSLMWTASPQEAAPSLELARERAAAQGDDELAARATVWLLDCQREAGRYEETLVEAEAAAAAIDAVALPRLAARVEGQRARLLRDLGRMDESVACARHGLAIAVSAGDARTIGQLSWILGSSLTELTEYDEARLLLDRAVQIGSVHGDRVLESSALTALAKISYMRGTLPVTVSLLDRVLRIAQELGQPRLEAVTAANLAQSVPFMGDYEAAERYALCALDVGVAFGYHEVHTHTLLSLASIRLLRGDLGGSTAALEELAAVGHDLPVPALSRLSVIEPVALTLTGRFDEAEVAIERGLAVVEGTASPREVALIRWAEGVRLDTLGRRADALVLMAELAPEMATSGAMQLAAQNDRLLAELYALEGRADQARPLLESALATAESGGLRGIAALSRVWLELLPGGNPLHARVELEKHGVSMPAFSRLRAWQTLAERGDDVARTHARADVKALIASAPAALYDSMAAVPLYRDALGEP